MGGGEAKEGSGLRVREFRSSGVREFRSSGVQEFGSSGVQEFRSSGVEEFKSSKLRIGRVRRWGLVEVETGGGEKRFNTEDTEEERRGHREEKSRNNPRGHDLSCPYSGVAWVRRATLPSSGHA